MSEERRISDTIDELDAAIRVAAQADLRECRQSRSEVALSISGLAGRQISLAQIDAWVAPTKPHRIPLDLLPAWVKVTGSPRILKLIAASSGYQIADGTEQKLAEYGRTILQREELSQREESLRTALIGVVR